jgi:hypothetical protein
VSWVLRFINGVDHVVVILITVTVYLLVFKMGTCIGKRIEMVFLSQNHSYNIIASRIQFKLL